MSDFGFIDNPDADNVSVEQGAGLQPARASTMMRGHDDVEQKLLSDYRSGRLPHAMVFSGPEGIGKATMAFRFARFLLAGAEENNEIALFGEADAPPTNLYISPDHAVSRRITSYGHADLLTIERQFDEKKGRMKGDLNVDEVRKIEPFVRKTAAEGGWRIILIDDAEHLNRNAQNAVLKILEEPPKKTLLILITCQPGAFLPTIRSRCRFYNFQPLPENAVMDLMRQHDAHIADDELKVLARLSSGSIGYAMRLYDEGGVALYRDMISHIQDFPKIDMVKTHALAEKLGRAGNEQAYQTSMELLIQWLEWVIRLDCNDDAFNPIIEGEVELVNKLRQHFGGRGLLRIWDQVTETYHATLRANLDRRQVVLSSMLRLSGK